MTVKELIEKLSQEDPNKRVVVNGYETGFDEVDKILQVKIVPNINKDDKHWEGEFDEVYKKHSEQSFEVALCLPRKGY